MGEGGRRRLGEGGGGGERRASSGRASPLSVGDMGIEPHFAWSSHTSDLEVYALVATLSGFWRYSVSAELVCRVSAY